MECGRYRTPTTELLREMIGSFRERSKKRKELHERAKRPYDVKVEEVVVVPDPVVPGKPATFNISASTDDSISGGKVVFTIFYNGMPVDGETRDLCQEVSCPISAGNFLLSYTLSLAGFFPPGSSYALRVIIVGDNHDLLTCFVFDFKVGFGSLVFDD